MFDKTELLENLFIKYDIANLVHGKKEDKLGDVMEEYCVSILKSKKILEKYKNNSLNLNNTDEYIFYHLLKKFNIDINSILYIDATTKIQHRFTGGNPKTDIITEIHTNSAEVITIPFSVKSSTARKVAMAEFDVDTIVNEVGITNVELKRLLLKHQLDASAKNFSHDEKQLLRKYLSPYAKNFVKWVLTGTTKENEDLRYPRYIIKFSLTKQDEIKDIKVYTIEEFVNTIMLDKNLNPKKGGFGTGLGWTYATGSKGKKIQFKG